MHEYGVADVEKLLRLSRRTIRALVDAGFVTPARGPRNRLRFSFQDLIVLRTAQALSESGVPAPRMARALKELRRQLPETMPLSGLSVRAVGRHVVVRDGAGQRQVESGQYLLGFEGDPERGSLSVLRAPAPTFVDVDALLARAQALEAEDLDAAVAAYEEAIAVAPQRLDARTNLGCLLHEAGRLAEAEAVYTAALQQGDDALLRFNFAVLLEDLDRKPEALASYRAALALDPTLADAYYNLALLCEQLERPQDAIRNMAQYRRLLAQAEG